MHVSFFAFGALIWSQRKSGYAEAQHELLMLLLIEQSLEGLGLNRSIDRTVSVTLAS